MKCHLRSLGGVTITSDIPSLEVSQPSLQSCPSCVCVPSVSTGTHVCVYLPCLQVHMCVCIPSMSIGAHVCVCLPCLQVHMCVYAFLLCLQVHVSMYLGLTHQLGAHMCRKNYMSTGTHACSHRRCMSLGAHACVPRPHTSSGPHACVQSFCTCTGAQACLNSWRTLGTIRTALGRGEGSVLIHTGLNDGF